MNWLLMVSDDGQPDIIVGSRQNWFAENGYEFISAIFIGIIIGLIISFWFCQIKDYIKSKSKNEANKSDNEDNNEEQ